MIICDKKYLEENMYKISNRIDDSNKYSYGVVGFVCLDGMVGAMLLSMKAALKSGCGLVKILCNKEQNQTINIYLPEAIVVNDVLFEEFQKTVDVLVLGPGMKNSFINQEIVLASLMLDKKIIYDAGAITILKEYKTRLVKHKCQCVFTPHIGEMERFTDKKISKEKRILISKDFYDTYNISIVLKSEESIVFIDDIYVDKLGNDGLATAGSGDALAGVIGGLSAYNDMNNSLLMGVLIHSYAADYYALTNDKRTMIASDIINNLFKGI